VSEDQAVANAVEVATTPRAAHPSHPRRQAASHFWTHLLEHTDAFVYILVGICFFLAALCSLAYGISKFGYSLWQISQALQQHGIAAVNGTQPDAARALIDFVSDLLLTLIIMEVLGTVVHYLRTRETSLKPFLFIGIVSATRGILAVGARLSVTETGTFPPDEFRNAMIELGVNAAVIIALGVTMRLIGKFLDERGSRRAGREEPLDRLRE
jgi:uncharacterized membrane protein (DUF373 family)